MKTPRIEVAKSFGFSSLAELDAHQAWLDKCQQHSTLVGLAVAQSEKTGVVDMRPADAYWDAATRH